MTVCKKQLSELFDGMVTIEYMDDYIGDIEYRVLSGMLPPEDMRIVERYKEYKKHFYIDGDGSDKIRDLIIEDGWT